MKENTMNPRQRAIAVLTIAFVLLFAVGGASIVSRSGTQPQQVATGSGSPGPQGTDVTTTQAPTTNSTVPVATPEERHVDVTTEQCHQRIGASAERDKELQDQGVTAQSCGLLLVQLCQKIDFDGVRALGENDPKAKCTAVMAGVTSTTNNAPTSTTPPSTAPPDTTPGTNPPGSDPPGTAAPTTQAPSTTAAPRQPDMVDLMIYLQKLAEAEGKVQGVGVTCEAACVLLDGITADTPEGMFAELLSKGVISPVFLDDAARTVSFQDGKDYTDTRPVGDPAKGGSDLLIVMEFVQGSTLERGILPKGTTVYNTVVQNGQVVQFSYTTNRDRLYLKIWKGSTFLMWFDSCGNRVSDHPTPGVPETPTPPPHDDEPPPTTTAPPPTGGPTPTTPVPTTGKVDTHPVGPNSPVPTQVQGPGPTHTAGPPNTGIENPNPTTGCNPTCPGATTTTTRPGPPPTVPPIVTSTTYQPPPVPTTMPPP